MEIAFIKREEIDRHKWDSCVHFANNGHVFGYTWYLDNTAEEWDGLVEGDYESVLPLIRKEGVKGKSWLYMPELVSAAGIFSVHVLSKQRVDAFISAIPDRFSVGTLRFLPGVRVPDTFKSSPGAIGHRLYLNEPYEVLRQGYSPALIATLEAAEDRGLTPRHTPPKPEEIADFFRQHHPGGRTDKTTYHALQRIMYNALHRGIGFASAITDHSGLPLAMNFFLFSHGKLLSLVPLCSKAGQQQGAMERLLDLMVQTQAGKPLILDFNLSSSEVLPKSFGAHRVIHHELGNGLPQKSGWWPWKRWSG